MVYMEAMCLFQLREGRGLGSAVRSRPRSSSPGSPRSQGCPPALHGPPADCASAPSATANATALAGEPGWRQPREPSGPPSATPPPARQLVLLPDVLLRRPRESGVRGDDDSKRFYTQRSQRPLTRYLPVRAGDINLRQHIESAGHAVELCADVSLDASTCRGRLCKASARFGNWQKRWFIFDRSAKLLMYTKSRRDRRPRGGVRFQSIADVYVDHLNGHKQAQPNCVFVVKTTERSYHLMAPSPEAMRIWVDVIITGAEAYQEFD